MAWGCAQYNEGSAVRQRRVRLRIQARCIGDWSRIRDYAIDYAGCDGPQRAVESQLSENKLIGLSWCLIDYDDVTAKGRAGFWNLSATQTFFGNADQLVGFRMLAARPGSGKGTAGEWTHKSST